MIKTTFETVLLTLVFCIFLTLMGLAPDLDQFLIEGFGR